MYIRLLSLSVAIFLPGSDINFVWFGSGLSEITDCPSEAAAYFRKPSCSKNHHDDKKNNQQLLHPNAKHSASVKGKRTAVSLALYMAQHSPPAKGGQGRETFARPFCARLSKTLSTGLSPLPDDDQGKEKQAEPAAEVHGGKTSLSCGLCEAVLPAQKNGENPQPGPEDAG